MIQLREPYQTRPIRCLEIWQTSGWRLKVYSIAYQRALARTELIEAAKTVALPHLVQAVSESNHYGVGFLGIHDGRGANFVFLDYWADENELHHHVYVSPTAQPAQMTYITPTGLTACVWDLRVMCFERQAWLETVLANPARPDIDAYLARRLNEDI